MRFLRELILCVLLFLCPGPVMASAMQGDSLATIRGRVAREFSNPKLKEDYSAGVQGAIIQLFYSRDGKIDSLYTTSDRSGNFLFRDIKPQRIGLRIQNMGYQTISGVYDIDAGDNAFFFVLKEQIDTLAGAAVTAEIPLIKQIADTTVYNTQFVRHLKDDDLRQVLRMLPGFEVTGNSISVDGHPVTRTYVNGTLVFGDKVTTAIDALRADEVSQVRVYDELSDVDKHRGLKNGPKRRVLDIITNDAIISMEEIQAGLAGGVDCTLQPRYAAAGILQFHSEMFQSSSYVDVSNINGLASTRTHNAMSMLSQRGPLESYKESQLVSLGNTKYWKSRYYGNSLYVSYELSHEYSKNASNTVKEYYGADGFPSMTLHDTLSNNASMLTHQGILRVSLNDTPLKSFEIEASGSLSTNSLDALQGNLTQSAGAPESRMHQTSGSKAKDYSFSLRVGWTDNDTRKWRPFVGVTGGFSNTASQSWTVDTLSTSYLKRNLSSSGYGLGGNASLQSGVEATLVNDSKKTAHLSMEFNSRFNHSKRQQLSYDEYGVDTPVMDIANTYDFTYNHLQNSLDARFNLSTRDSKTVTTTVSLIDAVLFDTERLPESYSNTKHYPSVSANIGYNSPILQFTASSSATTPALEQIRNRVSDANPLALTAGNPNLKQGYNLAAGISYTPSVRRNGAGRNSGFTASFNGSIYLRPIVSRVRYFGERTVLSDYDGYVAGAGSILNTFENSSLPRFNLSARVSYVKTIIRHNLKYDISLSENYLRSPMYSGDMLVPMDENSVQGAVRLVFTPSITLRLINYLSASHIISSRHSEVLSGRIRISDSFSARWFITKWLKFQARYSLTAFHYTTGTGNDYFSHILDAGLEAPLGRQWEIGLWGYDILKSGSLYTMEVNSAMMTQTWTPTYGRNIMLKVAYRFRKKN